MTRTFLKTPLTNELGTLMVTPVNSWQMSFSKGRPPKKKRFLSSIVKKRGVAWFEWFGPFSPFFGHRNHQKYPNYNHKNHFQHCCNHRSVIRTKTLLLTFGPSYPNGGVADLGRSSLKHLISCLNTWHDLVFEYVTCFWKLKLFAQRK